jgi:hypothetical protein
MAFKRRRRPWRRLKKIHMYLLSSPVRRRVLPLRLMPLLRLDFLMNALAKLLWRKFLVLFSRLMELLRFPFLIFPVINVFSKEESSWRIVKEPFTAIVVRLFGINLAVVSQSGRVSSSISLSVS